MRRIVSLEVLEFLYNACASMSHSRAICAMGTPSVCARRITADGRAPPIISDICEAFIRHLSKCEPRHSRMRS